VQYCSFGFPLSALGDGANGVVVPLFVLKVDPIAVGPCLDGVLSALKPPSISKGTPPLNSGSPDSILLIFLKVILSVN
jgi:hypothetical protein